MAWYLEKCPWRCWGTSFQIIQNTVNTYRCWPLCIVMAVLRQIRPIRVRHLLAVAKHGARQANLARAGQWPWCPMSDRHWRWWVSPPPQKLGISALSPPPNREKLVAGWWEQSTPPPKCDGCMKMPLSLTEFRLNKRQMPTCAKEIRERPSTTRLSNPPSTASS